MTGAGLLFGVLLSMATARLLAGLLYEVRTFDPLVFALAPMLLAASVLPASWLPARRATGLHRWRLCARSNRRANDGRMDFSKSFIMNGLQEPDS